LVSISGCRKSKKSNGFWGAGNSSEFSCQKIDYNFRAKELIAILGSRKFIISLALKTKGFFCTENPLGFSSARKWNEYPTNTRTTKKSRAF